MKDIKELPRLLRQRAKRKESEIPLFNYLRAAELRAASETLYRIANEIEKYYIE